LLSAADLFPVVSVFVKVCAYDLQAWKDVIRIEVTCATKLL